MPTMQIPGNLAKTPAAAGRAATTAGHPMRILAFLPALTLPVALGAQAPDVSRLTSRPTVQRAFTAIDQLHPRTIADQIRLTEIPAPPFGETARAALFAEMLREAGADSVWLDEEGNVLALRRGTVRERTIVLSGHLDTVFPEGTDVSVRVVGDTLFAPGVSDDTRGITVVLTVLRAMVTAGLRTRDDVLFVGTVGEEGLGDLRGVKHLFRSGGTRIDAFISVDGADVTRIVHAALGSHRYRITFRGPGGHSWSAFGLANPHHALGAAIARFARAADGVVADGPRTSYNVGRIGGGTSINSIPFESWMEVDMRSESPEHLVVMDSVLYRAVREGLAEQNALRREGDALTVDIELIGDRPSGVLPETHPFVVLAAEVTRHFGLTPRFDRSSTDANIPIARGIPAITISGGGVGANHHALDEYWVDENSDLGIKRALLIVLGAAGLEGN